MIHGLHTQPHSHIVHLLQHREVLTGLQYTRDPHISQGYRGVYKVDCEAEKSAIKEMNIILHYNMSG